MQSWVFFFPSPPLFVQESQVIEGGQNVRLKGASAPGSRPPAKRRCPRAVALPCPVAPKAPRTGGCGNPSTLLAETFSWFRFSRFRWLHVSKCCAAPRLPLLYSEVTVQRSRDRAHLSLMPAAAGSAALFHVLTQSAQGVAPINLPEASSEFRAAAPSEHTNSPASSPALAVLRFMAKTEQ